MTENKKIVDKTEIESCSAKPEKRTYTVFEIQDILGISLPTAYGLIKKNLFHTVKVGRHIRISKKSFDAWLDDQSVDLSNQQT